MIEALQPIAKINAGTARALSEAYENPHNYQAYGVENAKDDVSDDPAELVAGAALYFVPTPKGPQLTGITKPFIFTNSDRTPDLILGIYEREYDAHREAFQGQAATGRYGMLAGQLGPSILMSTARALGARNHRLLAGISVMQDPNGNPRSDFYSDFFVANAFLNRVRIAIGEAGLSATVIPKRGLFKRGESEPIDMGWKVASRILTTLLPPAEQVTRHFDPIRVKRTADGLRHGGIRGMEHRQPVRVKRLPR